MPRAQKRASDRAGFGEIKAGLKSLAVTVSSAEEFQGYLRTFVLHRHLELLPTELVRERFLQQLTALSAEDKPPWTLDYCRVEFASLQARVT